MIRRVAAFWALTAAGLACTASDLVIGDDSALAPDSGGTAPDDALADGGNPDVTPPDDASPEADPPDAPPDAPPAMCTGGAGTCLAEGSACYERAAGDPACPTATDLCCATPCPNLSPPAPTFCDGGPYAPKYSSGGCVIGYACAPVDCTAAGGTCVGIAPGACPSGKYGDATKYSCGGGVGSGCCLP